MTVLDPNDYDARLEALLLAFDEALPERSPEASADGSTLPDPLADNLRSLQATLCALERARLDGLSADDLLCDNLPLDDKALKVSFEQAKTSSTDRMPRPALAGQRVGRFKLVRELGRGGYGVVFLAEDERLGRLVALKVPRPEVLISPDTWRRFVREAKAAGVLAHPNLIPIHEVGEDGPICYIASEFCSGPNLAEWLATRNQAVTEREAAAMVRALAQGVAHAHRRGVLHRDIKPSNVLLEFGPETAETEPFRVDAAIPTPRLTDFGLAKVAELVDDETRSGTLLGTPAYMAPEQAEGRFDKIGPETDVYALGVLLYEMLVGRPPLRGQTDVQTLQLVAQGDVPRPRRLRPGVSRDLEAITLKCLEKQPASRYGSAEQLADDLQRFLGGEPSLARPAGNTERLIKWCRRRPAMAMLLSVVVAATLTLFGVVFAYNIRLGKEVSRAEREAEASRRLLYTADVRVAYETLRANNVVQAIDVLDQHVPLEGKEDLREFAWYYLRGQCDPPALTLAGHDGPVMAVAFSPDGKLLASGGGGSARLWDAITGKPLRVLRDNTTEITCVAFAPSGGLLATGHDNHTILFWNPTSGEKVRTLSGHDDQVMGIAFSPDGKYLASGSCDASVRVWDVAAGTTVITLDGAADVIRSVAFSAGGDLLFAVDEAGTLHQWRTDDWRSLAAAQSKKEKYFALAVSPLGARVAAAGRREVIDVWEPVEGEFKRLEELRSGHTEWIQSLAFSPLNGTLASAGKDCVVRLWKPGDTAPYRTLLGHKQRVWCVAWSPDGQRLASVGADGLVKIWSSIHDRGKYRVLMPATKSNCEFSSDGKFLVAYSGDGFARVWNVTTGALESEFPAHDDIIYCMALSPDGSLVATRDAAGTMKVWDRDSSRLLLTRTASPGTSSSLTFDSTGRVLAMVVDGHTVATLDVESNEIVRRFPHESPVRTLKFTPDGRYLITTSQSLQVWDVATGRVVYAQNQPHGSLAVTRDGRYIVASSGSNITLIDMHFQGQVSTLVTFGSDVTTLCIAPDGRTLAAGLTQPEAVGLWDIHTRGLLMQLDCDAQRVMDVSFSLDGRHLMATGLLADERSAIWDWEIEAKP